MSASSSLRSPSLSLISSPSPARPVSTSPSPSRSHSLANHHYHSQAQPPHRASQSPFRYVNTFYQHQVTDEKSPFDNNGTPLSLLASSGPGEASFRPGQTGEKARFHDDGPRTPNSPCPLSTSTHPSPPTHYSLSPMVHQPSPVRRAPLPGTSHTCGCNPCATQGQSRGVRRIIFAARFRPWLPFILYAATSLGFILAVTMWKVEVFEGLDQLSRWLQSEEYMGYAILFFLIFLTTFPPLPLYSTFTVLSGYTFGPWKGAVISYFAALSGALTVFILARTYFRASINRCLSNTVTMKRVVRAIEKRPKLLFLIRLAPYPYNVMNALLAGSPTLTLRTYGVCTGLSLFKVIIHTSIGSSIHSFSDYHAVAPEEKGREDGDLLSQTSTIGGIVLCVAVAVYLSWVARRAVDEELEEELGLERSEEGNGDGGIREGREMIERQRIG